MKQLRQAILWAVLVAIALLIVLSAIGALIGVEEARDLFSSPPLIAFWVLVLLVLASGFAAFRRLITAPAGLAMHLGAILIVAGAMWGSGKAHDLRKRWLDDTKVQSGTMPIMKGQGENHIYNEAHEPVATLPFTLFLRNFSIDYYPPKDKGWQLIVVSPVVNPQGEVTRHEERLDWQIGEEIPIAHTTVRMKVLQYLRHARAAFAEGAKPRVAITDAAGKPLGELEPKAGAEVALKEPAVTVRVIRVFQNLKIVGTGAGHEVIDDVGHGENPGLQVRVSGKEAVLWEGYVLPQMPGQVKPAPEASPLIVQYAVPGPTGAAEDPTSESPAMEIELTHEGRTQRQWLMPEPGAGMAVLPLGPVMAGAAGAAEAHGMERMTAPELYLIQPQGAIQSYKSDVMVLEKNRRVDQDVIEVNHPLHWGGYSFYQSSYDAEREAYTVLSVSSDSGLVVVYLGMAILSIGAFWRFWGEPGWAWIKRAGHGA